METPELMHNFRCKPVVAGINAAPGPSARYQYLLPGVKQVSAIISAEVERLND